MIKIFIKTALVLLLLGFAYPAVGQTHTASLTWGASPDAATNPGLGYNVYRLTGACPVSGTAGFTKINTTLITTLAYSDTTVTIGTFCYYATAALGTVESLPSNTYIAVTLPAPPPSFKVVNVN